MKRTILAGVILAVQCAAIGWLICRYERVVSAGTEVRFACQAYDPYDPLRGRYLLTRVSATCTNIVVEGLSPDRPGDFNNRLFARLESTGGNGLWQVTQVADKPSDGYLWVKPRTSRIDYRLGWSEFVQAAKGKDASWKAYERERKKSGIEATVEFPDQLFLNEKLAPEAEKTLRKHEGMTAVAVYRAYKGEIVITDIEVAGRSVVQK